MLSAAWRKMWVSRATGTPSEATSSANGLAGADGGQLIGVTHQHHVGPVTDGAQQRHQQLEVGHRGLVDDEQVAAQRVLLVVGGALARDPAQRRVHCAGAQAAGLGHAHRRPAGGGHQHHAGPALGGSGGDRLDRGRLAGAGTARDHRQPVLKAASSAACCSAVSSLGASGSAGAWRRRSVAQPRVGRSAQQVVHARGQLGLELGGGPPVDPLAPRALRRARPPARRCAPRSTSALSSSPASASSAGAGRHVEPAALGLGQHVHDPPPARAWPDPAGCPRRARSGRRWRSRPRRRW